MTVSIPFEVEQPGCRLVRSNTTFSLLVKGALGDEKQEVQSFIYRFKGSSLKLLLTFPLCKRE